MRMKLLERMDVCFPFFLDQNIQYILIQYELLRVSKFDFHNFNGDHNNIDSRIAYNLDNLPPHE